MAALVVVGLLVAAVTRVAPAAPALVAGPDRAFFGLQAWTLPDAQDVAMMKRGGAGMLRAVFAGDVLAAPAATRWARYDVLMTAVAQARIEVLPVLLGLPGGGRHIDRPRTAAEQAQWIAFVGAVASRYGRGGTFWADHPGLDPMPLTAYQVWNEPNLPAYWRPTDDAAGYLSLVRVTRARLRAVDPQALIVLAGLP